MPLRHAIWKVGNPPLSLILSRLEREQALEDMIVRDPGILSDENNLALYFDTKSL